MNAAATVLYSCAILKKPQVQHTLEQSVSSVKAPRELLLCSYGRLDYFFELFAIEIHFSTAQLATPVDNIQPKI